MNRLLVNELLHKHDLNELQSYTKEKGSFLVKEGEEMQSMYFLLSGTTKVYNDLPNGKRVLIGFFKSPTILGDIEYALDSKKASCTVETVTCTTMVKLSYDEIDRVYSDSVEFSTMLFKGVTTKLLRSNQMFITNMAFELEARLASYLLCMVTYYDTYSLQLIKYTDLATQLGTSYRHLHRVFKQFMEEGILRKNGSSVEIIQYDKLEQIAKDNMYDMENVYDIER